MNVKKNLCLLVGLLLLSACQKTTLQKESLLFSANESDYRIQLPTSWEEEVNPEETINANAVFGAKDTKSNSLFYVKADSAENLSKEALDKYSKKYLKEYYDLKKNKGEQLVLNNQPVVHYSFEGTYEKKPSWLDIYYVSKENSVVQFFFYSPVDNSHQKRQKLFASSIETLTESKMTETIEKSSGELDNKVENDHFSLQVSTYEIDKIAGDQLLIVRFLYKNKTEETHTPIDIWQKYVKVYQNGEVLAPKEDILLENHTLTFLQENSKKTIEKNMVIESIVAYPLEENGNSEVSIEFDTTEFPDKQPLMLKMN
ncbi:DUF5067 domain-containing protein [Enterococcus crotali]|uniref:DUF5067 domain-containing protein n=1 Tax=Enterococcus crotali TaxID=1453587 RepID=UPI000472935D|nr:DUF5067 domain-containing protein [Enterococcus crotali]